MRHRGNGESLVSILDDIFMVALALGSAGILFVEYTYTLPAAQVRLLDNIDLGIALIFLAEFTIKWRLASWKWRYVATHWWELLASIPVTTPTTQALRLLRLLRLIRLFRLNEGFREISSYLKRFVRQTHVFYVVFVWFLTLVVGAIAFFLSERGINPQVHGIFDGLWWAISTLTTVGYGDIYPMTTVGRVVGILLMLFGIGTTGVFTALVASFLVREHGS